MTLSWYLPVDFYWLKETGMSWGGVGSRGKFFRARDGPWIPAKEHGQALPAPPPHSALLQTLPLEC